MKAFLISIDQGVVRIVGYVARCVGGIAITLAALAMLLVMVILPPLLIQKVFPAVREWWVEQEGVIENAAFLALIGVLGLIPYLLPSQRNEFLVRSKLFIANSEPSSVIGGYLTMPSQLPYQPVAKVGRSHTADIKWCYVYGKETVSGTATVDVGGDGETASKSGTSLLRAVEPGAGESRV